MTTLEILRSARKLLSNPKRWTKDSFVRTNEDGESCYCAVGALRASAGLNPDPTKEREGDFPNWSAYIAARAALEAQIIGNFSITYWNDIDRTTYEDVMEAFSKACEAEFAKEQEVVA